MLFYKLNLYYLNLTDWMEDCVKEDIYECWSPREGPTTVNVKRLTVLHFQ